MEALFKKYFWVVNLAVLAAVAWLVAQTIVDYLAVRYLTVPNEVAEVETAAGDGPLLQKAQTEGLAQTLIDRSPFNVDEKEQEKPPVDPECTPDCEGKKCGDDGCGGTCGECEDEQTCEEGVCKDKEEEVSESELNIELKGTLTNPADPTQRFANILADGSAELVAIGSEVLDKAVVIDIQPKMLYLREGNKLTHVALWGEAKGGRKGGMTGRPMSKPRPRTTAQLKRPDPNQKPTSRARPGRFDYSKGVKKEGDFQYTIDKGMLDEQLTDLTQLGMQARVIPNYRKGKYEGFKLVGVRPGSLYRAIGIRSGDIVRSINGRAINSPNKAMELFNQLKNSSAIKMEVERRGKIENFEYQIQ